MGNPALTLPPDEPTPCWTCRHFIGLHTQWIGKFPVSGFLSDSVTCAERGRYTHTDPNSGCRYWQRAPGAAGQLQDTGLT